MSKQLSTKEKLFCYYYHKLRNCKDAAIKAGYPTMFAEKQGIKLLDKSTILSYIKKLNEKANKDNLLENVIAGLNRLAFSSSSDSLKLMLLDKDNLINSIDTLDLFHISEIKIPKDNSIEIKFFDRFKAFDKLIEIANMQSHHEDINEFYTALENSAGFISKENSDYEV